MNEPPRIDEAKVWSALTQVLDPELGCNIVDLGLVYGIEITGRKVLVKMTLTTPGCPLHQSIGAGVQHALLRLDEVAEAEVQMVWDPPWHPRMMSEAAREALNLR